MYWFLSESDFNSCVSNIGKESSTALDFPFSIIDDDTIIQIDEAYYGVYGVFEKSNRLDYQGHISNLVVLYSAKDSNVIGISTSFYFLDQPNLSGSFSYSSTTRDVNLLKSGSVIDSDTIPFVDEITLDASSYHISIFSYAINSFENEHDFEIGRVSFYYRLDASRDQELESAFLDELLASIRVVRF